MATKKIVVVTGANKHIGYEIVKSLLQSIKPYHIFLGSRSIERGNEAVATLRQECGSTSNTVETVQVDITSDSSIENAFETVKRKHDHIDVLINNAGINTDIDHLRGKLSLRESFTSSYDVNVAGTHVMSSTFMPLLLQSPDPRLIFISGLGLFSACAKGDIPLPPNLEPGWPKKLNFETVGYRCSKAAVNMLMLDYYWKLQRDGVKVWSVGPGMLTSDLGDMKELGVKMGTKHPSIGGEFLKTVVEGGRDADVGKYIAKDGVREF